MGRLSVGRAGKLLGCGVGKGRGVGRADVSEGEEVGWARVR